MIKHHSTNTEIVVDSYLVELLDQNDDAIARGEVSAVQKFQPEQKFIFTGNFEIIDDAVDELSFLSFSDNINQCRFVDSEKIAPIILINSNLGKRFTASFILSSSPITFAKSKNVQSIAFNLVNFNKEVQKTEIQFDDWNLKLEQIASTKDYKDLKNTGGYLVTHKGILEKQDKTTFSIDKSKSVLSFLHYLFSFCKGVAISPFLTEGLNSKGEVVWYEIGSKRIHKWKRCNNWFSDSRIDLNEFTSGFYDFCQSNDFKDHIAEIIYWYNTIYGSTNNYSAVIINHTALELISWIYLTEKLEVLTIDGYKKLSSGDCLSLTLGYSDIPTDTPSKLSDLDSLGKEFNLSGPNLYSTVRNKIVHPPSNKRDDYTDGKIIFEAKLLGTWYLELFILAQSNFYGKYSNTLNYSGFRGATEFVPWAKNS